MNTTKTKSCFSPRWARIALLMALLMSSLSSMALDPCDFMVDGIAYRINADGTSVSVTYTAVPDDNNPYANYTDVTSIIVPSSVNYEGKDYAVTAIGEIAFYGCRSLKQVVLPEGLITIGTSAFLGCFYLESVNIPNTVTNIEDGAFATTNISEIVIPNSVVNLGWDVFGGCWELSQVTLPESLTEIPPCMFEMCSKLKSISLPPHHGQGARRAALQACPRIL